MKEFRSLLTLVICVGISMLGYAQRANFPKQDGIYIQNGNEWNKLYLASTSGIKSSGITKSAFSYGIAKAKSIMIYRDAEAPVRTNDKMPEFVVVGSFNTAPRDIVIVRLKKKKDHRELQVAQAGAFSGVNFEYPPKDTISTHVSINGNVAQIVPISDLSPGEYVLFVQSPTALATGYGGFDFSVEKQ